MPFSLECFGLSRDNVYWVLCGCEPLTKLPKLAFLVILGQIFTFLVHFDTVPDQKQWERDAWFVFWYLSTKTFALSPKKIGVLAQKRPFLPQNMLSWAYDVLAGSFGALLVGGCGARAVSRKTSIYFIILIVDKKVSSTTLKISEI